MTSDLVQFLQEQYRLVDVNERQFQSTIVLIVLCPTIWNILARFFRVITSPASTPTWFRYACCYVMTVWIFGFSVFRDWQFHEAIEAQAKSSFLLEHADIIKIISAVLIGIGQVLVLTSFWKLGITGTYLGDYCGILMDAPVTSFPFNVSSNPMYVGSTLSFLGSSLWNASPAGVALTALIYVVYKIALVFEDSYTAYIYSEAAKNKKKVK